MLQCNILTLEGTGMATPKCLRRQAATCATLAKQTYDEESRQRYLRLEQTFLQLAETQERLVGQASSTLVGKSERMPAG
jgi:hypothetical protein